MAEGGLLQWKRQEVKMKGPVADYSCLKLPLPLPPKGMVWQHNEATREWIVVPNTSQTRAIKQGNNAGVGTLSPKDRRNGRGGWSNPPGSSLENHSINTQAGMEEEEEIKKKDTVTDGVKHAEHVVLPTDTFQGLCMRYRISAVRLRQVNMFSGTNLKLAPAKLIIPVDSNLLEAGKIRLQDTSCLEFKVHAVLSQRPDLSHAEAKYYLSLTDNDVDAAIREAREDATWEKHSSPTAYAAFGGDINASDDETRFVNSIGRSPTSTTNVTTIDVDVAIALDAESNPYKPHSSSEVLLRTIEMVSFLK